MPEVADSFADLISKWDFADPLAILALAAAAAYTIGLLRLRHRAGKLPVGLGRIVAAAGGFTALILAIAGPFAAFADEAFWLHMLQHLSLTLVAAPLLLLANPMPMYLWALPRAVREGAGEFLNPRGRVRGVMRFITWPRFTLPLFVLTLYIWHVAGPFNAALTNTGVHYLQHFTFFFSAALFWWPIIGPAPARSSLSYAQRMLYLVLVITPSAFLGAIFTLSSGVIYDHYLSTPEHWGMTALEDQTMAGVIMWVPGNLIYLNALTAIFFTWAAKEDKQAVTAARHRPRRRARPASPRGGTLRN